MPRTSYLALASAASLLAASSLLVAPTDAFLTASPALHHPSLRPAPAACRRAVGVAMCAPEGLSKEEKRRQVLDGIARSDKEEEEADPTRKWSHTFFTASLSKPMGMILEDNDPTLGGVYVSAITQNSPAGECEELKKGMQLVSVAGASAKGESFESIMDMLKAADSPVALEFYDGSASSLYGGWAEKAEGKEVSVIPDRPNKALIDRIRSGL